MKGNELRPVVSLNWVSNPVPWRGSWYQPAERWSQAAALGAVRPKRLYLQLVLFLPYGLWCS